MFINLFLIKTQIFEKLINTLFSKVKGNVTIVSKHGINNPQGRREGGAGGAICPENYLLGPSLFCVLNISAQRTRYLFFWAKYRNLAWKIRR
jgi:hypothetical protein